jgi:hypothetical protein
VFFICIYVKYQLHGVYYTINNQHDTLLQSAYDITKAENELVCVSICYYLLV